MVSTRVGLGIELDAITADRGGRVVRGKDKVVTDGPYVEAKDIVLGFIVIAADSLDEAARLASGCPIVEGGGSVEVRPVATLPV